MSKKIIIIGAGFGGMSAAAYLAKQGNEVTVLEKNSQPGGRAMVMKSKGFTFDLGPSWYMMPDVFDDFFKHFGKKTADYYKLSKLDPAYRVFTRSTHYNVGPWPGVKKLFNELEPGSADKLGRLLAKTKNDYEKVRGGLLDLDGTELHQVLDKTVLSMLLNPELLKSYHSRIAKYIKHQDLQHILEFMTVFMGGSPKNIPALYTLLAHVDFNLGIWYPSGGFGAVVAGFEKLAREQGVKFRYNTAVTKILTKGERVIGVQIGDKRIACDVIVANADYHFVETKLLAPSKRSYTESYWQKKTVSPSGLLGYIGLKKPVNGLLHHNLLFDADWNGHFKEVFKEKTWSKHPLVYICAPSKSDSTVAPRGMENLFVLAPMANGASVSHEQMERTMLSILRRVEKLTHQDIVSNVNFFDVKAHDYFETTFNAYKGNAFGLAHTRSQSGPLRPKMRSKKLSNLYFVGQYTNPGTGVPMVVTSGKVVANLIAKVDTLGE